MHDKLFSPTGAHILVDGQYGSTGKGVLAAWLAMQANLNKVQFAGVISNAGPNSGHTFYHGTEKHVLKQLPTFAAASALMGNHIPVFLDAGAIIDPEILFAEARKYNTIDINVHPNAVVITPEMKESEHSGTIAAVAGTRSGSGAALARKVERDPTVTWSHFSKSVVVPRNIRTYYGGFDTERWRWFVEVSQGFSLGLHDGFYPKVTSRECTVMQAITDARIPPRHVTKTYMTMRTYPIRVGNVDGHSSGDYYPDQEETTWEELGVPAELTTVTQRIRRVFTFSELQAIDAIRANDPDIVFVNFMNYLTADGERGMMETIDKLQKIAHKDFNVLLGYGATSADVVPAGQW